MAKDLHFEGFEQLKRLKFPVGGTSEHSRDISIAKDAFLGCYQGYVNTMETTAVRPAIFTKFGDEQNQSG
jgi:hypothetical protein